MDYNAKRKLPIRVFALLLRSSCCCQRLRQMIPFKHQATGFERFMLKTKSIPDGTAEEWLQDKGKLARFEGDKRRWRSRDTMMSVSQIFSPNS